MCSMSLWHIITGHFIRNTRTMFIFILRIGGEAWEDINFIGFQRTGIWGSSRHRLTQTRQFKTGKCCLVCEISISDASYCWVRDWHQQHELNLPCVNSSGCFWRCNGVGSVFLTELNIAWMSELIYLSIYTVYIYTVCMYIKPIHYISHTSDGTTVTSYIRAQNFVLNS